jgi:hypothetical protein
MALTHGRARARALCEPCKITVNLQNPKIRPRTLRVLGDARGIRMCVACACAWHVLACVLIALAVAVAVAVAVALALALALALQRAASAVAMLMGCGVLGRVYACVRKPLLVPNNTGIFS